MLETPGGSFLAITQIEPGQSADNIVAEAAEAMDAEYEDIESEPYTLQLADQEFHGTILRFYYLDFVIVSQLIAMQCGDRLFLVQVQGEDRDVEQQSLVFEAILTSMLRSLADRA